MALVVFESKHSRIYYYDSATGEHKKPILFGRVCRYAIGKPIDGLANVKISVIIAGEIRDFLVPYCSDLKEVKGILEYWIKQYRDNKK